MKTSFIYIRGLRHAEHTVFCVQEEQKTFYDNQFGRTVPYSSGQQVKRSALDSVLEILGEQQAPITFNKDIKEKGGLGEGEPWSPCDPQYTDQLLGGWMRAQKGETPVKRRSPLSISAMRALHPLLSSIVKENLTFDRSSNPDIHPVRVRDTNGKEMSNEEIRKYLEDKKISLTRRNFIQDKTRATGLFVFDIAIDLRTLFSVSLNKYEREITDDVEQKLRNDGWKETKNAFGGCLICPKERRDKIIRALVHGLINWRITSNQSRTFSLMETLAITISNNANKVASAIRAKLSDETEKPKALPIIDDSVGADLFIALPCDGYIQGVHGTVNALEDAEKRLAEMMLAFDYENQLK
ncbi:MAG: CRISPR-associated protein Cas7 [Bacteroidetes bacterium]|nr:CRISPR-associated protein Cas7 [Bacteroidota bacterium]MBU1421758.1 CRISPR-associated protein Cas7 [Bacteroidota bacterium]MBU2471788.1 CRISPR-associated protein Cas7 [Bacteroidota bacterium]MBU2637180.1 CRISPR-associated protein Cas7 [Bacteroidota bacterium]